MNFYKNRLNQILFLVIIIFAIIAGWSVSELIKKRPVFDKKEENSNDIRVNFNLTNHFGIKVSEKDYQNYSKVFFFGFTFCPDICPISANLIANAIDELEKEQFSVSNIKFFFVTVDPKRDTPERLNEFLDSFDSKIIGLTGTQKELLPLWKNFFVHVEPSIDSQHQNNLNQPDQDITYEPEIDNYMVQHTAFFYFFDKDNNIKSILPFGSSIEQMKKELKILGHNKYGSLALEKANEKDCNEEIELLLTHENTELWASYSKKDSSLLCLYTCVNDVCMFSTEKD